MCRSLARGRFEPMGHIFLLYEACARWAMRHREVVVAGEDCWCIVRWLWCLRCWDCVLRESGMLEDINVLISSPRCFYFVIYCFIYFLVSAAALRSTTVGSEPTSTGRCEPVGTEQRFAGSLVVFASLRSVQSGHPPDVLHPCICPYQSL